MRATTRETFQEKTRELRKRSVTISTLAKQARHRAERWPAEILAKINCEIETHLAHSRTLEENLKTISSTR